jgi:hypothetical protein
MRLDKENTRNITMARTAILKHLNGRSLDEFQLGCRVKTTVGETVKGAHIAAAVEELVAEGKISIEGGVYRLL